MNVVYLVIFVLGGSGNITSQTIPQKDLTQCKVNAAVFNRNGNAQILPNGYRIDINTSRAYCIAGVK